MSAEEARLRELVRQAYIDGFNAAASWRPPPTEGERGAESWLHRHAQALADATPKLEAPVAVEESDLDQLTYQPIQAAKVLGISRSYFWKCVKAGRIPTFRWLDLTMVRAEDLRSARDAAWSMRPSAEAGEAAQPWPPGRRRSSSPTPP